MFVLLVGDGGSDKVGWILAGKTEVIVAETVVTGTGDNVLMFPCCPKPVWSCGCFDGEVEGKRTEIPPAVPRDLQGWGARLRRWPTTGADANLLASPTGGENSARFGFSCEMLRSHPMSLTYTSGEEIRTGDRILYHGEPAQVEFVARGGDPETNWYVDRFGGGCMILAPSFGRVFVSEADEDLEFVARDPSPSTS